MRGFRPQALFYLCLSLATLIRCVFFSLQPLVIEGKVDLGNKTNMILNTASSYCFFSGYLVILLLWAELYHSRKPSQVELRRLLPLYLVLNALMYTVVITLYVLDFVLPEKRDRYRGHVSYDATLMERGISLFDSILYLSTSIAFFSYALLIFIRTAMSPSAKKRPLLIRIGCFAVVCSVTFAIRSAWTTVGIFVNLSAHWYFDGLYFFFLEIVPVILMILILRAKSGTTTPVKPNRLRITIGAPS